MTNFKFYNLNDLLSRNGLFNFSVGTRGIGKTYGFKRWSINDYIKSKKQFIYLRRYETELDEVGTFFNDIAIKYPKYEFDVKGRKFLIKEKDSDKWNIIGYNYALSTAHKLKSTAFPNVNKIGFDEFILEKGSVYHYLPNEVDMFLNFYETVNRTRDDTRVLFIGNAITIINPYFLYWNIKVDKSRRFYKFRNEIIVDYLIDSEFINQKENTRFGQLTKGTRFNKTSVHNEFVQDSIEFIQNTPSTAKFAFSIWFKKQRIGLWYDQDKIYCSDKINNDLLQFCVSKDDLKENVRVLSNTNHYKKVLRESYEKANIRYSNLKIKSYIIDILKVLYIAK